MVEALNENVRALAGMVVWTVLKYKAKTSEVKVTILKSPLPVANLEVEAGIPTEKNEKKDYLLYSCISDKTTEIAIYEKTMSLKNAGKTMSIFDNFGDSMDSDMIECYKNSIVEFILANIVWK